MLQLVLALLTLKVAFISGVFNKIAKGFTTLIHLSHSGAEFLFGNSEGMATMLVNFAFWTLPTIIFFSALSALLYCFGVLQGGVQVMAWVMKRVMEISGAESVAVAANVFVGQTEAPLILKPYLGRMTKSEIHCLMVGGMATIAGGY